jgi:hypothetical protein
MRTVTITKHYHDLDTKNGGLALELPFAMSPIMEYKAVLVKETDTQIIIGYLADDEDCGNPLEDDGYLGHIYEARRNGPTLDEFNHAAARGDYEGQDPDPFVVMLDYHEHGQCQYSLAGEGMQCRFDTVKGNVCWVPSECLRDDLVDLPADEAQTKAREYAKQAAETYTNWRNGECYGVVTAIYDLDGDLQSQDDCWGFIGADYAYNSLKSDYFPSEE